MPSTRPLCPSGPVRLHAENNFVLARHQPVTDARMIFAVYVLNDDAANFLPMLRVHHSRTPPCISPHLDLAPVRMPQRPAHDDLVPRIHHYSAERQASPIPAAN